MQYSLIHEELEIPKNISVNLSNNKIVIKGPKAEVEKDFSFAKGIQMNLVGNKIIFESTFGTKQQKATLYSIKREIENIFVGVTKGYRYYLKIIFTHFPTSVKVVGNEVQITNLIGEKNIRRAKILQGVKVTVKGEDIIVEGADLEKVAQTAANIESTSKIKGFDRRVFSDGIYIYKKEVVGSEQ
ncbi:50S ribosomal protein L6 [Acidianus brierleyi]|uniref:Large ribosomal subunit protein uL6 n=1 Tax=Acidianus brierleyi TaxID=41673 RepID=A0A2U9IEJ1_9CREN|nr:50S ribosomal protein L6 [Acidianus brierleyi]AWR94386.1 50S ribosomal protein L6 [Acidianus brierleyi]